MRSIVVLLFLAPVIWLLLEILLIGADELLLNTIMYCCLFFQSGLFWVINGHLEAVIRL